MSKILNYLDKIEQLKNNTPCMPVTCEIDPCQHCQNDCSFCISGDNKKNQNIDLGLYMEILKRLKSGGVMSITFTGGGEPLLHPEINQIIKLAVDYGFKIGLITNGINLHIVDESLLEYFTFIRVSLDAGSKDIYSALKQNDAFDQVVDNISSIVPLCKTVGLSYVIDGQPDEDIDNAEFLAEKLDVCYIQFKPENGRYNIKPKLSGRKSIYSERIHPNNNLACAIAGLIGIITAEGNYAFCCQHRYDPEFIIGNLNQISLEEAIQRRVGMLSNIDPAKCVSCRYMTYATKYMEYQRDIFRQHKEFL